MSPCNCGSTKKANTNFAYVAPNGTKKVYNTEVEARAAQIRNGGGTYTPVPAR